MASLSFDPVAHIYDATRGYSDAVAQQIAQGMDTLVAATAQTSYLEVGIGTGRIALPLANLGRQYTGVDISEKMLAQLEKKLHVASWQEQSSRVAPWGSLSDEQQIVSPTVKRFALDRRQASLRLILSDIASLPFVSASFDVIIGVHIFHLLSEWRQALSEVLRVLKPEGNILLGWDRYEKESVTQVITDQWRSYVRESGGTDSLRRRLGGTEKEVTYWLQEQSLNMEETCVARWEETAVPSNIVEFIAQRSWSSAWAIPEDIFVASIAQLRAWANDYFRERFTTEITQSRQFMVCRAYR